MRKLRLTLVLLAFFGLIAAGCASDSGAADEALAEAQGASAAAAAALSEAQAASAAAADIGAAMAEAQAASAAATAASAAAASAAADAAEALAAADLAQATASGNEAAAAEAEAALAEASAAASAAGEAAAAAEAEAAAAQEEAAAAQAEAAAAQQEAAAAQAEAQAAEEAAAEAAAAAAGPICGGNTTGDLPQGVDSENGVLTIGTVQPVGGAAVVAGIELLGGIKIAVEEINANGGIDGCMIELVDYNSQYEVEELINQTRRMIDRDGVWAILSPADSRAIPGTFDFLAESGVPMWAPISPPFEIERQEVSEQARICVDHFHDLGFSTVATIGATNPLGEEVVAGVEIQAPINGMEIVAQETVESASEIVGPAVLNVIASGAEGIVAGVDNIQNALILQILAENNSDALLCSDQGAAGSGGQNAVGPAEEAADGFLGALQVALPDTDSPLMSQWRALRNAYCDSISDECRAANFSEQTYLHSITFFEVIDRLNGDLSWDNFHAVAEGLRDNPIETGAMPPIGCGPRAEGGHACASGAGLSEYDYETETWTQIREFQAPYSS
ncbi:MAG: ABC transporter substrate-binding protein [Acidimicrobiia bacterium]|nr:ABC transporter substrate-binding protein [Acidimicrobiia bacterium]